MKEKINNKKRVNRTHFEHPSMRDSRKNKLSFGKCLSIMFVVFFTLLISIVLFANNQEFLDKKLGQYSFISNLLSKLSLGKNPKNTPEIDLPFGMKRQNILLLGVDSNGADSDLWVGTRTDTMIVLNIDPKTKTVNALTIPRDSKVYLPSGMGIQKINAAHAVGGINMTIKTVEDTLGIKIDKYIMFHDAGVREVVKALGGVDIYVEKPMNYDDYSGRLHIHFQKGKQHLTERNVVEYLRFRHDATGDIGRTKRQQWFLRGLLAELQKPETIVKIPQIISVTNKYVKTNITPYEMTQYAGLAKHFDMDSIESGLLPGAPSKTGAISYWILDPEKTQEVVDRLIYRQVPQGEKESYSASIMYSKDRYTEAANLKKLLEEDGINVICQGVSNSTHAQFIGHSKYVTIDYYAKLKKEVPEVKSKQFVYEPSSYLCSKSDFTIVLAGEN